MYPLGWDLGSEPVCGDLLMPTDPTCILEVLFPSNPSLVPLTKLSSMAGAYLSAQFHPTEVSAGASETALQFKSKQVWKFANVDVAQIEYKYAGNGQKGSFNITKVILH